MRISDWSSDVCSSDLHLLDGVGDQGAELARLGHEALAGAFGDEFVAGPLLVEAGAQHALQRLGSVRVVEADVEGGGGLGGDDVAGRIADVDGGDRQGAGRKSVGLGRSVSVRVDLGGRCIFNIKKYKS